MGSVAYITPEGKDYKWYISGIYCQLGDYMPPTSTYHLLREPKTAIDQIWDLLGHSLITDSSRHDVCCMPIMSLISKWQGQTCSMFTSIFGEDTQLKSLFLKCVGKKHQPVAVAVLSLPACDVIRCQHLPWSKLFSTLF